MTDLSTVLKEILESRRFLVDRDGPFIRGRRDDIELNFFPYARHSPAAIEEFMKAIHDRRGKVILAALVPLAESISKNMPHEVVVWDREAIEHEIGRTRIESMVGEEDHGLIDDLFADDFPIIEQDGLHEISEEERILPMQMDLNEVVEMSAKTVSGFSHRLELVPHFLFSYDAPLYVGEGRIGNKEGIMAVNAMTKASEFWNEVPKTVPRMEQAHKRLEPIVEEEEAASIVRSAVEKEHTYDRDTVRESGHTTMTEKIMVHPRLDEGSIKPLGIIYIPIWCIEGTKGVMIVNASTGKVLSEDYFHDLC